MTTPAATFDAHVPTTWTRTELEAAGYEGFATFEELQQHGATKSPGIYVVLRSPATPPVFLTEAKPGGAKTSPRQLSGYKRSGSVALR
ncbi:hypothetical protein [Microbacterium capsulatum]|uniref:Uncharacterized protein n=1 Tax=Microbacterium capsulatum TaxID=3041921 RepID=A0ABU0XBR1_9MICO|nr:hypothetical protein [Microbacterium sp. ASV81]MDQ4212532.1 hypothetical protein [Microbacterium sp. ASV81]